MVFTEVKARQSSRYGRAEERVDLGKQKRIGYCAAAYLARHRQYDGFAVRFDVIAFNGGRIRHIQDAFDGPRGF